MTARLFLQWLKVTSSTAEIHLSQLLSSSEEPIQMSQFVEGHLDILSLKLHRAKDGRSGEGHYYFHY